MKSIKRLIATIIALSMLLSLNVIAADFNDVEKGSTHEKAIDVLSDIGIVKGYEDGNYKPDKEVTRAEITSLLMRMVNLSITGIEVPNSYYTDVANNHWAVYDINTATDKGVIAGFGDGIFGPDRSVTYEQAVKMIVCLLGYESKATDADNGYTGWPEGYMRVAREIGLLTNSQMDQKANAPRKIIAQLLYNALEIQMVNVDGKLTSDSILKTYLQIEKVSGMIVSNSKTTLSSTPSIIKEDEIQIQSSNGIIERYKVGDNTDAVNMLGINVVAYTKYDDTRTNRTILNISTQGNVQKTTVNAEAIETFNSSRLVYKTDSDSGRTKEIAFATGMKILYNDKYIDTDNFFNSTLDQVTVGEITVTTSGNGICLVEVQSYKTYVVKSIDTSNEIIYIDTSLSDPEIDGVADGAISTHSSDTINWSVKFIKNNKEISMSSIRRGNVISVKCSDATYQNNGAKIFEVIVSDSKVSGKITGTEEGAVEIASKSYKIAPSLEANSTELSKLVYDATGTFYLDAFGKVAYVEIGSSDSTYNGYIIAAAERTGNGNAKSIVANILDANSKSVKNGMSFAEKYTIDGAPCIDEDGLTNLLSSAGVTNLDGGTQDANTVYTQPIKYTLNNSGKINSVITVNSPDFPRVGDGSIVNSYRYSSNTLKSGSSKIELDNSTVVYVVPSDRTKSSEYRVSTKSYFGSEITYKIEAFGRTNSGAAAVVVVYSAGANTDLKYNSPLIVFEKKNTNASGETYITGYNFTSGAKVTYVLEDPNDLTVRGIERGDIIRFGTNADGEISNDKLYKYLDVSDVANAKTDKYSSSDTATPALMNPANLPNRYMTSYGTNASFKFYDNRDITADRSDYRTYTIAMALTFNDDTNTLRYTTDYGTGFDRTTCLESAFEIKSDVDVFVFDDSQPETKVLTYVTDSTERENAINSIRLYDGTNGASFDYVYLYGTADTLHAMMIIKNN